MAMIVNRSRSAILVIFASLLIMGSFSPAAVQDSKSRPLTDQERKEALERLTKQLQKTQAESRQSGTVTPKVRAVNATAGTVGPNPQATTNAAQAKPQAPAPTPVAPGTPSPAPPAAPSPAPPPTPIPSPVPRDGGRVQLSYENADLYDFINQIASILGLTPIVIDPDVKGSVTIQSSAPMSKDDVLPLFNMILKNNNAALVKDGNIYQIVPISSALKKGVEFIEVLPPPAEGGSVQEKPSGKKPAASAPKASVAPAKAQQGIRAQGGAAVGTDFSKAPRLATHVIRVEFVPVKDLIEPIKLFMTEGGVIMPYERLNMLIITDYTDSADRVLQIVRMLDDSYLDPDLVEMIKIKNYGSADLCEDLKKIFGSGTKDSATGISFVSLDRQNAIFVIAGSKRGLEEVKRWIKELDSETGRNIQTYVYVVENSTASNIAMMLAALYGGDESTGASSGQTGTTYGGGGAFGRSQAGETQTGALGSGTTASGSSNLGRAASSPFGGSSTLQSGGSSMGGYQAGSQGGYSGGYQGGGWFGGGQQLGPRLTSAPSITSQILRGGVFTGLQDTVRLVVDDVNNSLIVQATQADYAFILETIKKMDVLPRQVIIDARIFAVDLTDALSFGVSGVLQGRTTDPANHLTTAKLDAAGALAVGTFAFVGDSREILLKINALREKTKVKVLEAPSVLALDGTVAKIVVGSEIAYPGSSFTSSEGSTTQSVQYRDTGISLIVQPRISASGSVTLSIAQEVSSPGADTSAGPSFRKSSVETVLSVKDGETVAIAGLIRDADTFGRGGIPFLSDIPILGYLFGTTTKTADRSELIILITPHVIRTPEKFQEMTQELRDSLRNVRKYADEKEKEHVKDMEDARDDRYKEEQKRMKKTEVPEPEKK